MILQILFTEIAKTPAKVVATLAKATARLIVPTRNVLVTARTIVGYWVGNGGLKMQMCLKSSVCFSFPSFIFFTNFYYR